MAKSNLAVPIAYISVILIWSTTPLAMQWSIQDAPIASVLYRTLIGMVFCLGVLLIRGHALPMDKEAWQVYLLSGISLTVSMSLIYLSAQFIPSGWIAVLFGLSPLSTGLMSAIFLKDSKLAFSHIAGLLLGASGLMTVFSAGLTLEQSSLYGVALCTSSVLISSAISIITRQLVKDRAITGMQITAGSLLVASPLFFIIAASMSAGVSVDYGQRALWSIIYLGLVGSGIGFTLYYFLLKNISANTISLVTLITPISGLLLGNLFNNEPLFKEIWLGAALVCAGLALYQFPPKLGLRKL